MLISGTRRFTFETPELAEGINCVIVAMGMFGIGDIIRNLEHDEARSLAMKKVDALMLNKEGLACSAISAPSWTWNRRRCCRALLSVR